MKATITNTSRALQGVHSVDGLVFIDVGQTRPVDVADDYVERVKALPFFTAEWDDTPVATKAPAPAKPSAPSAKSAAKTPVVAKPSERDALKARATELKIEFAGNISTDKLKALVEAKEAVPKAFDDMSDTELKTFLTDKGVTVADETRDQLLELAKAA